MIMKKAIYTVGGATLIGLVTLFGIGSLAKPLLSGDSSSAQWTAEMLCKSWEEQKKSIRAYSTENGTKRGYKIAIAKIQKEIRQNSNVVEVIKKENKEEERYKIQIRKLSKKICSADQEFTDGFLKSLDKL